MVLQAIKCPLLLLFQASMSPTAAPTVSAVQGVLQWAQVEAAVAAGCHTCKDILQHISTRHHQQQQQLTAAQAHTQQPMLGGRDSSSDSSTATAGEAFSLCRQVVPVVSREHLQRQLKAWVDEGRLVKAARNCFTLPEQPA